MKITSISLLSNVNRIQNKNILKQTNKPKKIPENKLFQVYFGRDLVSSQVINPSYFKLPAGCQPDDFQKEAALALSMDKNVIVEAPTGTGKTAIAYYTAVKNMKNGKKTFYTTPLKALSNQKLNEFKSIFGEENVGILTGDRRENPEAPILIMTTEVYRNMALSKKFGEKTPLMNNLGTVIFDECHYLGDISRGATWEESIMLTPKDTQVLALSATIGNPKEIKSWMNNFSENNVHLISIPPSERYVPLYFDRLSTSAYEREEKRLQKGIKRGFICEPEPCLSSKPTLSDYKNAVEELNNKKQLPAIFFVFSKKFSGQLVDYFEKEGPVLTTETEQKEISRIVNEHKLKHYIGADLNEKSLKRGYAIHNAGIIPAQKELIEELFQKKLIKAVISTETLSAGINMPAKTVVISSTHKPVDEKEDENRIRLLTTNEFKQMAGRAGRRGIDKLGYVYTMPTGFYDEQEFLSLESMPHNSLESRYNPEYSFLTGYFHYNSDTSKLSDFYSQTFYTYNDDESEHNEKLKELIEISSKKIEVMKKLGFLKESNDGIEITQKGELASNVRGYDTLLLTELISNGVFDDISPETLAMTAGLMAIPANFDENELTNQTDISYIFDGVKENIGLIRKQLIASINTQLKKFGKTTDSFSSYEAILDYIKTFKQSTEDEKTVKAELDILFALRSKLYKITSQTGKYSPEELVNALKEGKVIPTKVMQKYLEAVDKYKKKINGSFDEYINNLKNKLDLFNNPDKGKKAQARMDKKKEELLTAIKQAELMQYLDNKLAGAINSNYLFIKKYPPEKVKADYEYLDKKYAQMTSEELIAKPVKALIQLDLYNNNLEENNKNNSIAMQKITKQLFNSALKVYETEIGAGLKSMLHKYNKDASQILYLWSYMNKMNPYSMLNWAKLNQITGDKFDEGTIYRSVMQSADLLSQIQDMARTGHKYSNNAEEAEKYDKLAKTANEARRLIIQEPVEV